MKMIEKECGSKDEKSVHYFTLLLQYFTLFFKQEQVQNFLVGSLDIKSDMFFIVIIISVIIL